mmetsp:Transcript_39876/g.83383  ORF Transcript_39876/g.83383 Transcript_39876/m.83383 type:complete len:326 (+) Transcript_39876:126-1103(+)
MSQNGWHPLTKDLTYVQHLPKVLTGHQPQPFHIVIDRLTYQNSIGAQQPLYNRNHLSQRLGILPQTLFRGKTCQGSKIAYHSLPLLRGTNDDVQEDVAVAIHHSHATGITMRSVVVLTSGNAFLIPANIATPVVDALGTGSVSGGDALHVDGEKRGIARKPLQFFRFLLVEFYYLRVDPGVGRGERRAVLIVLGILRLFYCGGLVRVEGSLVRDERGGVPVHTSRGWISVEGTYWLISIDIVCSSSCTATACTTCIIWPIVVISIVIVSPRSPLTPWSSLDTVCIVNRFGFGMMRFRPAIVGGSSGGTGSSGLFQRSSILTTLLI